MLDDDKSPPNGLNLFNHPIILERLLLLHTGLMVAEQSASNEKSKIFGTSILLLEDNIVKSLVKSANSDVED
uniref:Uncharacterized protein n=1 Tax=Romanomermis culicivorax TaxID=13658 RepID=A0A915I8Y8_ROMCU